MTPKEKAKELFDKFCFIMPDINDNGSAAVEAAKQCALIAVDEILNTHMMFKKSENSGARTFWLNVKKEIERL